MAKDSYNDTSTAQTPAHTGSLGGGVASEKNPSAKGTAATSQADGTASPRVTVKTIQADGGATPKGGKSYPPGVTHYSDAET